MPTAADRRAYKEELREQNQRRWREDQANANVRHLDLVTATGAIPIDLPQAPEPGALDQLRAIMLDHEVPLSRRLRAGAAILKYEIPPGAAAGRDREEVRSTAYRFFSGV